MNSARTEVRVYPPGYGHGEVASDYRPWEADGEFLAAWRSVRAHTLLDPARLYELWELSAQAEKVPGDVLEVGTWRGGSAAIVGLRLGRSSKKRLYVADTFRGVAKASDRDPYYVGGEHSDTSLDMVDRFLHSLATPEYRLLPGIFPDETAHLVPTSSIALCHIDVDVYDSARGVFDWVFPRLSVGGIVVFDDYGFYGCEGITSFVHELRVCNGLVVVANVNGHAVVIKTHEGRRSDDR